MPRAATVDGERLQLSVACGDHVVCRKSRSFIADTTDLCSFAQPRAELLRWDTESVPGYPRRIARPLAASNEVLGLPYEAAARLLGTAEMELSKAQWPSNRAKSDCSLPRHELRICQYRGTAIPLCRFAWLF